MPTLTPALLVQSYVRAEALFADSAKKQDYVANVEAANAVIENTTADLKVIEDNNKKRTARIYWNKFCDASVSTSTPTYCAISGTEADASSKDYTIDKVVSKSFTIDEKNYTNSNLDYEQVFADNMLKVMRYLDEKIASVCVSSLESFDQVNAFQAGLGVSDITGTWIQTYIQSGYWSPDIIGYMLQVAKLNKFSNPFILDGSNLYQHYWKAQMNAGNANGSGAKTMFDQVKYYSDLFNVDAVAPKSTFLIDRGSCAFASKSLWDGNSATNPIKDAGTRTKFSIPSNNIKGLKYDVYIIETCSDQYTRQDVQLVAEYGVYNGAAACNGATGVLELKCGTPS